MKPQRVQLKRTKGYRMPPNTVSVARPSRWGNPFLVREYRAEAVKRGFYEEPEMMMAALAVHDYEKAIESPVGLDFPTRQRFVNIRDSLWKLRGKNLACFCQLDQPCHADVLLALANTKAPK